MKFVLCCGDRNWDNRKAILQELKLLPSDTTIIHGGCRGADNLAGEVAKELGLNVIVFPANWDKLGKAAGPIRNAEMLDKLLEEKNNGNEVSALAFHETINQSRGTLNMVNKLNVAGIEYRIIK